jgi:hypothetical protein
MARAQSADRARRITRGPRVGGHRRIPALLLGLGRSRGKRTHDRERLQRGRRRSSQSGGNRRRERVHRRGAHGDALREEPRRPARATPHTHAHAHAYTHTHTYTPSARAHVRAAYVANARSRLRESAHALAAHHFAPEAAPIRAAARCMLRWKMEGEPSGEFLFMCNFLERTTNRCAFLVFSLFCTILTRVFLQFDRAQPRDYLKWLIYISTWIFLFHTL